MHGTSHPQHRTAKEKHVTHSLTVLDSQDLVKTGVPKGEVGKQNLPLLCPPRHKREGGPLRPIGERTRRCHYQENEPSTQRNIR